jgi:preprotein translocase subunit YajC
MNFLNFILIDGTPAATTTPNSNPYSMWIMLGLLMVVFYFFMIRPQSKRQKELKLFRSTLAEGDKVVTMSGIYGKIAQVKDNIVLLEIDTNVRVKVDINSIVKDTTDVQTPAK